MVQQLQKIHPRQLRWNLKNAGFPKGSISFSMFRIYVNLRGVSRHVFWKTTFFTSAPPSRIINCVSHPAASDFGGFKKPKLRHRKKKHINPIPTVDGRNPAPVDVVDIPVFIGFYTSQVVQDFFHQQYVYGSCVFLGKGFPYMTNLC